MGGALLALACGAPGEDEPSVTPEDSGEAAPLILPTHNECRPEPISEEICRAVIEEDGKQPTVSEHKSGIGPDPHDPRAEDPELLWLRGEIQRCACACCHTRSWGGPGVYHWDLEWSPVWIDSASSWTLGVLRGDTENPDRTFLFEDRERVDAILTAEIDRRRDEDAP